MIQKSAYFTVTFFLLCTLQTEAVMQEVQIRALGKKCGASEADVEVTVKYKVPDTPTGKCLMLCMLKEVKTLTSDGSFVEAVAFESLKSYWEEIPVDKLKAIAHYCAEAMASSTHEKNTCEYGYQSIICINKRFVEVQDTYLPQEFSYSPYIDFGALRKYFGELQNNGSKANFRGRSVINVEEFFEEKLLPTV